MSSGSVLVIGVELCFVVAQHCSYKNIQKIQSKKKSVFFDTLPSHLRPRSSSPLQFFTKDVQTSPAIMDPLGHNWRLGLICSRVRVFREVLYGRLALEGRIKEQQIRVIYLFVNF